MKISPNFDSSEFACKCGCGLDNVSSELVAVLELVRIKFRSPVTVSSGCRCKAHNEKEGGAPRSKHLDGIAADIKVKGVQPNEVYNFLDRLFPHECGLGQYETFTHVDVRKTKARW